jgi:SAM-dependent methyltransferase
MALEKSYVLGTHDEEIARLGLQHRVWLPHASAAWRRAGFTTGQTLLDIGCGPGWAAMDLAELVGPTGRVIAIDRSRRFLETLKAAAAARRLESIQVHELDLDEDSLPVEHADGAWSRWVYAFVKRPREVLARVGGALRPGGTLALHEYIDYRAWRLSPRSDVFEEFVAQVMASWRDNGGEPDIALELPGWLQELGFEILELRAISEIARPRDYLWQWPRAFVETGVARLVDLGRISETRAADIRDAFARTEATPGALQVTPTVLEIVAAMK